MRKRHLPKIEVSEDTVLYIEQIGVGGFAPLKGFLNKDDYESVLERKRLASGEAWTIPINLPVERSVAKRCAKGYEASLFDTAGTQIAILEVEAIYRQDKRHAAAAIYGTTSLRHPGVKHIYSVPEIVLGGKVRMLRRPLSSLSRYKLEPAETRRIFKERGWKRVAAFHTRNVPHRAHEYLQRTALEFVDGILIQPFVGRRKDGDFSPELIIKGYKTLIENYYPKDKVVLSCLEIPMSFAGPREAIFHAIIRRNYGCTHFVVGRDHAGVGTYYDTYAAHRIFDELPDLGITPLKFKGPFYCHRCKEVVTENSCGHTDRQRLKISGTIIRDMLKKKKSPPEELMRPEVTNVIMGGIKK